MISSIMPNEFVNDGITVVSHHQEEEEEEEEELAERKIIPTTLNNSSSQQRSPSTCSSLPSFCNNVGLDSNDNDDNDNCNDKIQNESESLPPRRYTYPSSLLFDDAEHLSDNDRSGDCFLDDEELPSAVASDVHDDDDGHHDSPPLLSSSDVVAHHEKDNNNNQLILPLYYHSGTTKPPPTSDDGLMISACTAAAAEGSPSSSSHRRTTDTTTTPSLLNIRTNHYYLSLFLSCWSKKNKRHVQIALLGCTCSALVLTIRLLLDREPSAYVIHSIIIFFDMILIHIFTSSIWLSVSGELVSIIFFLAFHYTNETITELLETTIIAALCSFNMISSRNQHWDSEEQLQIKLRRLSLEQLEQHSSNNNIEIIVDDNNNDNNYDNNNIDTTTTSLLVDIDATTEWIEEEEHNDNTVNKEVEEEDDEQHDDNNSIVTITTIMKKNEKNGHHHAGNNKKKKWCSCGLHEFFEHFLDGSAGVMYTSFVGLIIDEAINLGNDKCST